MHSSSMLIWKHTVPGSLDAYASVVASLIVHQSVQGVAITDQATIMVGKSCSPLAPNGVHHPMHRKPDGRLLLQLGWTRTKN